jgi:hypothetical protein
MITDKLIKLLNEDISFTEKAVLKNLHMTGTIGKSTGSLPMKKRVELLNGLIEKGYLNSDGSTLTKKGIEVSASVINENKTGFHIRDTLVSYDVLDKLDDKTKKEIMALKDEFDSLNYIDVRTELGPSQSSRMSNRQRENIKSNMYKAFDIESKVKQLLKSNEQKDQEAKDNKIKEINGNIMQKENYLRTIEGLGRMSHMKNGKLKPSYQRINDHTKKEIDELKRELQSL